MEFKHIPVMLEECISGLNIKPDGIYVDGTLGGAGHSNFIVQKLNKNARDFVRFFLSGAVECEIDKQGRFLIPNNLRVAAELEKEAVIIGVGTRLEIWNKENWEKCDENISVDEIAQNMTMLGI